MKIQSVYVFVKLAENNCDFSISTILGIPRSSMWANISDLEKTLGKKLINRKKQSLSFTKAGEEFIPYAFRIYKAFEESLAPAHSMDESEVGGEVIISATNAFALWSFDSIKALCGNFSNLRLHLTAANRISREEVNASDILIRPYPESEMFQRVWYCPFHHGLFASPSYIAEKGLAETAEDLTSHRIIGYGDYEFSYFEEINWHLKGIHYGLPKLKPFITINSTKAIYDAAAHGLGICSAPIEANSLYSGSLVRVLPHVQGPTVNMYFCVKRTAAGRKLNSINIVKHYFEELLAKKGATIIPLED